MNLRKKIIIIGMVILMGGYLESVLSAEIKIGYVDIQKAVNECNAGKEAKKSIAKELEKFQRLYLDKQKELQTMKDTIEKQAPMLTPEARATKEKELQAKGREFQRWVEDNQNELNQKRMEIERTISIGLQKIIQKVGTEEGYTLIVEKNETIVLFASKSIDLTDKVIRLYDSQKR